MFYITCKIVDVPSQVFPFKASLEKIAVSKTETKLCSRNIIKGINTWKEILTSIDSM